MKFQIYKEQSAELKKIRSKYREYGKIIEQAAIDEYYKKIIKDHNKDFAEVYEFYIDVYSCIDQELCLKSHLSKQLMTEGNNFFSVFFKPICEYEVLLKDDNKIMLANKAKDFYFDAPSQHNCNDYLPSQHAPKEFRKVH